MHASFEESKVPFLPRQGSAHLPDRGSVVTVTQLKAHLPTYLEPRKPILSPTYLPIRMVYDQISDKLKAFELESAPQAPKFGHPQAFLSEI